MSEPSRPDASAQSASRSHPTLGWAFRYAGRGVLEAFKTQRNMKIHGVIALGALAAAALLELTALQWALIVVCIVVVFAAECANTAIEAVVDLVTDDYAELARIAKDCAAGAVLVCAIGSVIVGLLVYLPAIVARLS